MSIFAALIQLKATKRAFSRLNRLALLRQAFAASKDRTERWALKLEFKHEAAALRASSR